MTAISRIHNYYMANIIYSKNKSFSVKQSERLFQSVGWLSAKYPERLYKALNGCDTLYTAWDGDRLVGLINAIDDGELTAYVHYLLIDPEYQKSGIGKTLLQMVKDKYKNYLYLLLVAENPPLIDYYESCGFEKEKDTAVMVILNK